MKPLETDEGERLALSYEKLQTPTRDETLATLTLKQRGGVTWSNFKRLLAIMVLAPGISACSGRDVRTRFKRLLAIKVFASWATTWASGSGAKAATGGSRRYGRYIRLEECPLKLGQYLFLKHGGKVVFFGRFVAVLRAWATFLAGTNRLRWPRFLLFNAAGGIIWATLYGLGGYLLGDNGHRLVGPVGIALLVLAVFLILVGDCPRAPQRRALGGGGGTSLARPAVHLSTERETSVVDAPPAGNTITLSWRSSCPVHSMRTLFTG